MSTPLSAIRCTVETVAPTIRATIARGASEPLNGTRTVRRVLFACSVRVAHTQFDGSYAPPLFKRSMVQPFGRSPMSSRNASNEDAHRLQTTIPRPPYLVNALFEGSPHRLRIAL
jgi:hypothetical protein